MDNAFVAFWVGLGGGAILGIVLSAVFAAVANSIDGRDKHD